MKFNEILIAFNNRQFRDCFSGKSQLRIFEQTLGIAKGKQIRMRSELKKITVYSRDPEGQEKIIKDYLGGGIVDAFAILMPEIKKAFKRV